MVEKICPPMDVEEGGGCPERWGRGDRRGRAEVPDAWWRGRIGNWAREWCSSPWTPSGFFVVVAARGAAIFLAIFRRLEVFQRRWIGKWAAVIGNRPFDRYKFL